MDFLPSIVSKYHEDIKIWAQMFFDDGSVSMGVRIPDNTFDDDREIMNTANILLQSTRRDSGYLLLWGAGDLKFCKYTATSSSKELKTLVSVSSTT